MKPVSAKLTTLVHATEDTGKVSRALDQVCPAHMFDQKTEERKFKGHYGNEIITLTLSLRKRSVEPFLLHLMRLFSRAERASLIQGLDDRIDNDGHLYLRLEKQECLLNRFRLVDQDPIKCEFTFGIDKDNSLTPRSQVKQYLNSKTEPAEQTTA
ncbi:MAG TPA: RNA-binding domain-containing protein [Candidatus Bathyarchaeia archaeon]|nr:RNA-binding domain-containing protein [Candidatus Bathyarchaeia archaeon]